MAESFEVELRINLNAANLQAELSRALGGVNQSVAGFDSKIAGVQKTLDGTSKATQGLNSNLSTTRYALYDVASTLAIAGGAMLGLAVATTAVAIAWERDFAQVVRTTGVVGDAVGELREQIVDLAQTMPVSFGDLAKIATLGGQLGVPEERIASFTQTVAKFSAVTDVSVDAAAKAFGRLDALLPDVQGNYEALGSSIARVGVRSVATESQIIGIATQISSMGAFAGLTADEVVGLSGALASVGTAPELSRGTVTRLFTQISKAVSEGGEKLDGFAKVAGVSSEKFAQSFGTAKFGGIFQSFIKGLDDTTRTGGNAVKTLNDLGLTSVRDVPLLLRLAGANDVVTKAFADAASGYSSAIELNKQYAVIAETTAARIQVLVNNVQAFLDAVGSTNLGPLGDILDVISGFFGALTDFASTDIGGRILGIVVVISALGGALGIAAGALALFGASMIGMNQGLIGIVALAPKASAAILGSGTAAAIASGELTGAAASAKLFMTALKALSVIGLLLVLPDLMSWGADLVRGARDVDESVSAMTGRIKSEFKDLSDSMLATGGTFSAAINRAFAGADAGVLGDIKKVDEALADMAKNGHVDTAKTQFNELKQAWIDGGGDLDQFNTYFTDTNNALKEMSSGAANGKTAFSSMDEAMAATEAQAQETEDTLKELKDMILSFNDTSINAEQAQINLQRALNGMATAAADSEASIGGTNAASLELRQSFIDVEKAARDSAVAVAENGGDINAATAEYNKSREAIIAAITAKTGDEAAARQWADTILGTSQEAQAYIQAYINKLNAVPESKTTRMYADTSGAVRSVDSLIGYINSRVGTVDVQARLVYESGVLSGGRGHLVPGAATGGHITGPGTATSDSILARLSNNEYVMRAAAVDKYGVGFMQAVNSLRVPKFAGGGPVSGSAAPSNFGGVVELGPKSLSRLSQNVTNNIMLDDVALSRSVERGNSVRRSTGEI